MRFKDFEAFQFELSKLPPTESIIVEDGVKWLSQEYAITRMNEVFGEGNWNIEKISKGDISKNKDAQIGFSCALTVTYIHPITGEEISRVGLSGDITPIDNNIIGRAFLNAISSIGNTFGRLLSNQFE